jgi:hypothetical protein
MNERCEGIKANGEQCKCYGIMQVNRLWYCQQHGNKELRALAAVKGTSTVGPAKDGSSE